MRKFLLGKGVDNLTRNKGIGIRGINIVYLLTALLLISLGAAYQEKDVLKGLLFTEYVLVLLPPLIYIKLKGDSFKRVLRLNALRLKHAVMVIFITILSYPVALFFNLVGMTLLSTFGEIIQPPIPTAENFREYFILMLVISVSAGICEEVYFRGLILRGYEGLGIANAIVISSVLFGVFHFNLQNLLGPIVLGLIFGYLVYRTDSIFAGILGHITNNGVAVTLGYIANVANERLMDQPVDPIQEALPGTLQLIGATFLVGVWATVSGLLAYLLLRVIIRETEGRTQGHVEEPVSKSKVSFFAFIPVILTLLLFAYIGYLQILQMGMVK
ncbi:hypothetical protein Gferi_04215 [Geosporobacter ferrireducens]|uniref:CAAX prenyl protease 2/Lysostaphin resistance protein A-like domain-containing protein n=1 Tax=Geosporobacter ferrireducens TaxID=1424294 RepID=A0A1D8GD45_9FIRM|nr:hypothetical protein Gferi_04215 [Geosporobacter ferrireducens]